MLVENVGYSSLPRQVYFSDKIKSQQSAQTLPIAKNTDKPQNSSNVKAIGFAAAAGLAIITAACIAASRGKIKSKPAMETVENAGNKIKNLSLDAFKKAGNKFEKGKAITKTGEGFTGVLEQSSKSGRTYVKRYENGLLSESKIFEGEKEVSSRMFEYNTEGIVNKVTDGQGKSLYEMSVKDGKKIIKTPRVETRYNAKTGKITAQYKYDGEGNVIRDKSKRFYYTKDGKKYSKDLDNKFTAYYPDGRTPEFSYTSKNGRVDSNVRKPAGREVVFYDKNGKVSRQMFLQDDKNFYDTTNGVRFSESRSQSTGLEKKISINPYNSVSGMGGRSTSSITKIIYENSFFTRFMTGKKQKILEKVCFRCNEKLASVSFEHGNVRDVQYDKNLLNRENNPELYDKIVNNAKEIFADVMKKYRESLGYKNKVLSARQEAHTAALESGDLF